MASCSHCAPTSVWFLSFSAWRASKHHMRYCSYWLALHPWTKSQSTPHCPQRNTRPIASFATGKRSAWPCTSALCRAIHTKRHTTEEPRKSPTVTGLNYNHPAAGR